MTTFTVPLVNKKMFLYAGESEWRRFDREAQKDGAHPNGAYSNEWNKNAGRCFGSHVWVDNIKDGPMLIHEMSHFVDNLMGDVGSDDTELRAYITENIMTRVLTWAGLLNGDK